MDSRREFLKKAALLSGGTGLAGMLPASIQRALAIEAAPGTTFMDAEHIVILMQENRSFDHCFGTLQGVRGFNDPRAIQLPNKNAVFLQTNAAGETYAPFRMNIKESKATWMHSLPHSWSNQVDARNDGKYDKWLDVKHSGAAEYAKMPLTMGYYTREDIPFYYSLADAFTVCDQHFCSSLTGTNPNRLYFWTGTIRDTKDENARACVWNDDMDYGTLHWTTFPERLEKNNVSWKVYQNEIAIDTGFEGEEDSWLSNFQDNPLEFFAQYNIQLHDNRLLQVQKKITALTAGIKNLQSNSADAETVQKKQQELDGLQKEQASFNEARRQAMTTHEKNLHQKAFATNTGDPAYRQLTTLTYNDNGTQRTMQVPKGDVLHQFRHDVQSGQLPTVSWLAAPENFSDHPTAAWYGAWYLSEVMDILTQNPEVWKKTIFILTYDENDGYFDHVPPYVAPNPHNPGTGTASKGIDTRTEYVTLKQEQERKGFPSDYDRESAIGLGYRVPLVIASPWSKGGWVNSQVFDHTSTLQFLEKFLSKKTGKQIEETNITDWRRTVCGNLESVFRPWKGESIQAPQPLQKEAFLESIHNAKFKDVPKNYKILTPAEIELANNTPHKAPFMPRQEPGIRASCALPYELYADGHLSADKKTFHISFAAANKAFGQQAAGAPFNVYAPGNYQSIKDPATLEPLRTWAYAVSAGDQLVDQWPLNAFQNSHYHLRVYGPNGFYREFKGHADDPLVHIDCRYQHAPGNPMRLTGKLELQFINNDSKPHTVRIKDQSYHTGEITKVLAPHTAIPVTLVIDLEKSHGWYDHSIFIDTIDQFEKRYAGRIETGRPGFSDPAMGNK